MCDRHLTGTAARERINFAHRVVLLRFAAPLVAGKGEVTMPGCRLDIQPYPCAKLREVALEDTAPGNGLKSPWELLKGGFEVDQFIDGCASAQC